MYIRAPHLLFLVGAVFTLALYGFLQQKQTPSASQMTQDDNYLYVLQGKWALKFSKTDLRPAANQLLLGEPEFVPKGKTVAKFKVKSHEVHQVLLQLFNSQQISCGISPEVRGIVSVDLKNASFETTLDAILKQVHAAFVVNAGVYVVIPSFPYSPKDPSEPSPHFRELNLPGGGSAFDMPPANNLMIQDTEFLFILQDNELYKVRSSDMKLIAKETVLYRG